jgi:hypothetical protein
LIIPLHLTFGIFVPLQNSEFSQKITTIIFNGSSFFNIFCYKILNFNQSIFEKPANPDRASFPDFFRKPAHLGLVFNPCFVQLCAR